MKILHVCLAAFYIDNYSYQENILPREHKKMGYQVEILASTETFIDGINLGYTNSGMYFNEDNIQVTRIDYSKFLPHQINKKLRIYKSVKTYLNQSKPEIVFFHDLQFWNVREFITFKKKNKNIKYYADCHTDFSNSAKTFLSKYLLHKLIYRSFVRKIDPYIKIHYGVLPSRCEFLAKMYGIDRSKIKLLVMGAEDEKVAFYTNNNTISQLKLKYGINDELVFLTGGKIDQHKFQVLNIMKAFKVIIEKSNLKIKLIVFGSLDDKIQSVFYNNLIKSIEYVGWVDSTKSYELMSISDILLFPGRHSVYWEQAIGMGKPLIVKKWDGLNHIDFGGNVEYFLNDKVEDYVKIIEDLIVNQRYIKMKSIAESFKKNDFLYSEIAKKSIEE